MSDYCSVRFCNLKMTKEQARNILKEYNAITISKINSIEKFLDLIGLQYEHNLLDNENEDIIVPVIGGDYCDGYDFESILKIIARNIDKEKRYIFISRSYDYDELVKYVFYGGQVQTVYQVHSWQDKMDNDLC